MALLSLGWRWVVPGSGRLAARIARPVVAGALACGAVLAMTAPALGQPPSWSVVPSANGGGVSLSNELDGVSCVAVTACTAVGSYQNSRHVVRTLIESWNGTSWSAVPSPNVGLSSGNYLNGVSCVAVTVCTAVGLRENSSGMARTLVESWDGTSWSVVPSPNPEPSSEPDVLDGVSCVSATACTAVGFHYNSSAAAQTLVESWDGTSWSVVPSPNRALGAALSAVSCVSATACTAVGDFYRSGDVIKTLAESWNGTSWSVVPAPNPPPVNGSAWLTGVSCVSATACTAVGYREQSLNVQMRTLVESWNGTSWSVVPSPNAGRATSANGLGGVSCVSATACTAAGEYENVDSGTDKTLVESWNGTSWSVVPSPNAGLPRTLNILNGVSCLSATACTAAGAYHTSGSPEKTLIESSG
jgi:hypothetical protein